MTDIPEIKTRSKQSEVKKRREKVQQFMSKGILSPSNLAKATGFTINQIKHDLVFFKKNANTWLDGLAIDGYTFQAQNTDSQLQDMIEELQQKRTLDEVKSNIPLLIKIDNAIAHLLSLKWQLASNGSALMTIRRAQKKYANQLLNSK